MAEKKFDPRWLEGLMFNYAEKNMVEKNGRKTLQAVAKQRKLTEEDILLKPDGSLAFTDYGDRVVIVTKDGKKHTVKKKGGKEDLENGKSKDKK